MSSSNKSKFHWTSIDQDNSGDKESIKRFTLQFACKVHCVPLSPSALVKHSYSNATADNQSICLLFHLQNNKGNNSVKLLCVIVTSHHLCSSHLLLSSPSNFMISTGDIFIFKKHNRRGQFLWWMELLNYPLGLSIQYHHIKFSWLNKCHLYISSSSRGRKRFLPEDTVTRDLDPSWGELQIQWVASSMKAQQPTPLGKCFLRCHCTEL